MTNIRQLVVQRNAFLRILHDLNRLDPEQLSAISDVIKRVEKSRSYLEKATSFARKILDSNLRNQLSLFPTEQLTDSQKLIVSALKAQLTEPELDPNSSQIEDLN